MKDLRTQIKTALKKVGLSEDLFDQIKVEKEEDIDKVVDGLKIELEDLKTLSSEDFLKAVEKAGLSDPLQKYLGSESDRRISKAIKTHDEKLVEETKKIQDQKDLDEKNKHLHLTDDQKRITNLEGMIKEQSDTLSKILQKTSEKDVSSAVSVGLKEAKLDEGFAENISVKSVEEVGDAIKNLSDRILSSQQTRIDKLLEDAGVPSSGTGKTPTQLEAEIAAYAEGKGTSQDGGGLISAQLNLKEK